MVRRYRRIFIHGSVPRTFLVLLSVLLLYALPMGVNAQESTTASQNVSASPGIDSDASDTLTAAQREARQLATTLGGEREARQASPVQVPLPLVPEQVLQPGRRLIITIFRTPHLEARLLGGVQTFASPVATTADTARNDARRPQFLPAEQGAVALEVLTK
jgi:hypothetical protein